MPTAENVTTAVSRYGAELTFEMLGPDHAPLRVHRTEDTLLRVIDGIVRLAVDGAERLLGTGDEAIVPAGAPHRIASAGGTARILLGFRAA
jgi:mannose-6-phosphate isomerase-like protein (cupin superfamily)